MLKRVSLLLFTLSMLGAGCASKTVHSPKLALTLPTQEKSKAECQIVVELTSEQLEQLALLLSNARTETATTTDSEIDWPSFFSECAENGSCYGDISAETLRPKTVHVKGYYRKDGTYVRGHYRSKPKR